LYLLADRHPHVAMAKPMRPEPKFFLIDELYARGLEYYAQTWFDPLPPGRVLGEKSTNYLESPAAAERLGMDLPGVKLIFLLRNPVDRAFSNYLWSQQNGLETETFERALDLEKARERNLPADLRYARPYSYFARGLYADQLVPFLRTFPRDQVLALRTEDVASSPRTLAATFHRFIGVEERPDLADGLGLVNAAETEGTAPLNEDTRALLADRYREPNQRLVELLGPTFTIWTEP